MEKLPEKWFIKTTKESNDVICDWYNSFDKHRNTDRTIGNFYCQSGADYPIGWMHYAPERVIGYTEITFEQFKKFILNKNNMENKSIKINPPEGMEVDIEKSSFLEPIEIVFKTKGKQLPKTWEELKDIKGYYIDADSIVKPADGYVNDINKNVFPTKELAEAALVLAQLLQLRDAYNDGWIPDWENNDLKYSIYCNVNIITTGNYYEVQKVMTFKTKELRDKFFYNFQSLLETAKPLL